MQVGGEEGAGERLITQWDAVMDRRGELVPAHGFSQAERELASAGMGPRVVAVQR